MPGNVTSNCACNIQAPRMPATALVPFVKQIYGFDRFAQKDQNSKENGLRIPHMFFNQYEANDESDGFTVSIRNGSDIVVEKIRQRETQEIPGPVVYGPKTSAEVSSGIVSVLERYRMAPKEHAHEPWEAKGKISRLVEEHVEVGRVIPMVLPAFPFKSPNKKFKVLGHLPDKGEEVALAHLNGLCELIKEEYKPGAKIDIVSDGLMYSDLLGISDEQVWAYGQSLRKLAVDTGCNNISFIRLVHLLGECEVGEPLSEEQYLKDAPWFRTQLLERNIPDNFDVSKHISLDPDTTMTYRGYIKFLEKDLDDSSNIHDASISKRQIKKRHEETARKMIIRGRAFAIAIAKRFDKSIRLSIHPSTESAKISIAITPIKDGIIMTPWHSSLVRAVDGSIRMAHAGTVPAFTHELIFENDRPSYFREKSSLYDLGSVDVDFQYTYPTGITISPRSKSCRNNLSRVNMRKVRVLAELCSPVVLRGWLDTPCQNCCCEPEVGNRTCSGGHGIIRVVEFCDGTAPGMNGFLRNLPQADQYEVSNFGDFNSGGCAQCGHTLRLLNGYMEHQSGMPQSMGNKSVVGCMSHGLRVPQQQPDYKVQNKLLNKIATPLKPHAGWKMLKEWSDMCTVI
ncbi:hypothetical protein ACO22_04721 [Paracoccidioides brasiliensis]|uniref:Pyoverdine/dityrosine biosynthesis protein n=1 Tax=Paracoccidioides brasiliensis TaxID=121759 RepID=A0A1D2JCF2_PARBR|nr:hypothetical protein ACO22_04721 [Paracoccidioides brasiliensis]